MANGYGEFVMVFVSLRSFAAVPVEQRRKTALDLDLHHASFTLRPPPRYDVHDTINDYSIAFDDRKYDQMEGLLSSASPSGM